MLSVAATRATAEFPLLPTGLHIRIIIGISGPDNGHPRALLFRRNNFPGGLNHFGHPANLCVSVNEKKDSLLVVPRCEGPWVRLGRTVELPLSLGVLLVLG